MDNLTSIKNALIEARQDGTIEQMESLMLEQPQVEIDVKEDFKNGLYTREILIPAGTLLTGRVHKHDYIDIMISGHIIVAIPDGVFELKGYNVCDGKAGRKRAGYALEDTLWLTVHREPEMLDNMFEQISFFSLAEYKEWKGIALTDQRAEAIA